jgi:hypothetical protein
MSPVPAKILIVVVQHRNSLESAPACCPRGGLDG